MTGRYGIRQESVDPFEFIRNEDVEALSGGLAPTFTSLVERTIEDGLRLTPIPQSNAPNPNSGPIVEGWRDGVASYLLDIEADCILTESVVPAVPNQLLQQMISCSEADGLVVAIRKKVGRATMYRVRAAHFSGVGDLPPDEQAERSQRSRSANDRRAFRRAADFCHQHDCRIWLTLTFDNLHLDRDPVAEARKYFATVSDVHLRETGEYLEYRAVVADHGERPHIHGLLSQKVDVELLREHWECGVMAEISEIDGHEIDVKVRYMIKNVSERRLTKSRFLGSRGGLEAPLVIPVAGRYHARSVVARVVFPNQVSMSSSLLEGGIPVVTYRFDPVRDD